MDTECTWNHSMIWCFLTPLKLSFQGTSLSVHCWLLPVCAVIETFGIESCQDYLIPWEETGMLLCWRALKCWYVLWLTHSDILKPKVTCLCCSPLPWALSGKLKSASWRQTWLLGAREMSQVDVEVPAHDICKQCKAQAIVLFSMIFWPFVQITWVHKYQFSSAGVWSSLAFRMSLCQHSVAFWVTFITQKSSLSVALRILLYHWFCRAKLFLWLRNLQAHPQC